MKNRMDTKVPQFKSLEEEKEYWEARGPLAEGHRGRVNKSKPGPKRSSFLGVRLTGEELTRLRDIAAKQGLLPSTFARIVLMSVISNEVLLPRQVTWDDIKKIAEEKMPEAVKERSGRILKTISIGNPPFLLEIRRVPPEEWESWGLQFVSWLLAAAGVEVVHPKGSEEKKAMRVAGKREKLK